MKIQYGLAEWDRASGVVSWNINLPMDGVEEGTLYEFFQNAGNQGWELCAAFPVGTKGMKRPVSPSSSELRECQDPTEEIAFIFKHVGED